MRKHYLDNIRWITILMVVIFHIFYYYNNIGIEAMFAGAKEYMGSVNFAGLYQYFVYPWFMLLLFVVAGISARAALGKRTNREFLRARVDKILVPSTLGVLAFGWIGGYVIYLHTASTNLPPEVPGFVRAIIVLSCGIGALWFCHVLFVAVLILMLVRKLLAHFGVDDDKACAWIEGRTAGWVGFTVVMVLLYLIFWGGAHILNMPLITAYRNGIYIPAFLAGFYIFSNDKMIEKLKKAVLPLLVLCIGTGIFYMTRCYGLAYSDVNVLSRFDLNLYAFCMVLFILGAGARCLNFSNRPSEYMRKCCFGIYVFHIPVMLVINYLLIGKNLPLSVVYLVELVGALAVSLLLNEVVRRIPILRYWILGIRSTKKK